MCKYCLDCLDSAHHTVYNAEHPTTGATILQTQPEEEEECFFGDFEFNLMHGANEWRKKCIRRFFVCHFTPTIAFFSHSQSNTFVSFPPFLADANTFLQLCLCNALLWGISQLNRVKRGAIEIFQSFFLSSFSSCYWHAPYTCRQHRLRW